jgi:hypothetical protein
MSEAYRNFTLSPELTMSYVCEESELTDPFEIFTAWFSKLNLFNDNLSLGDFNATFTACECIVDSRRSKVHSVRDRTYDDATLRTYILLYTCMHGKIYIVGACDTRVYLISKSSNEDLPLSSVDDINSFLNELSRQKGSVYRLVPHLFSTVEPNIYELTSFETYKEVLDERLPSIARGLDPEFCTRSLGPVAEHVIYMYCCFAASASGRVVDNLVRLEVALFKREIAELKNVPWLRHEFIRRFLGVDWEGLQTHYYRDIFIIPLDNNLPLYDSAFYSLEHCYAENAFADFFVKVPALYSPMKSQFHCTEHENSCTSKLSLDKGKHIVPYGLLEDCAVKALEKSIRKMCAQIGRHYSTNEALSTWLESVESEEKFKLLRISEEPDADVQDSYFVSKHISERAAKWFERLQTAKDNPQLVCRYDKQIIETVIIPFWHSVVFTRYNERLDRIYESHEAKVRSTAEYSFDQPIPQTYDQLLEFADQYWSPCIIHLLRMCKGSHLEYRRRIIVVRFLISPIVGYSLDQAAALWELFWKESDAYVGEGNFWSNNSEHARTFKSFVEKDRERWKYWPPCKEMVNRDLCPFTGDSNVPDIEDSALGIRQTKCVEYLKRNLALRGRQTKFRDPKIYSPISYTTCANASFPL